MLTEKNKRFIDEYLIDLNATRAYMSVYPKTSYKSAGWSACRVLKKPAAKEYLKERQDSMVKRTEITQDSIIKELAKIAFSSGSDFARVVTENGCSRVELINTDDLPEDKKAVISCIKETKSGITVEPCDKVKALELLGKHLGIFKDKIQSENTGTINVIFSIPRPKEE